MLLIFFDRQQYYILSMEKKLLLFDHDGVLVDTEQWYYQANREILAAIGIDLDFSSYMEIMINGRSALELAKNKGYSDQQVFQLRKQRTELYQHYLKTKDIEIPHVIDTLRQLKPHYQMAIVTTSMPDDFAIIHQDGEITKYMDKVFTRETYQHSKPHPEPYQTALTFFNVAPEKAVVIEDSERGLKSALAAGIDCIIMENHFIRQHDFSGSTATLKKISDLPDFLSR